MLTILYALKVDEDGSGKLEYDETMKLMEVTYSTSHHTITITLSQHTLCLNIRCSQAMGLDEELAQENAKRFCGKKGMSLRKFAEVSVVFFLACK